MRKWKVFCCFCLVLLSLLILSSCTTTRIEYVPMQMDLTDVVNPVLETRPDNSVLQVYPGPIYEDWQVLRNAQTFLYAWEMWEAYADALEQTIDVIQDKLK